MNQRCFNTVVSALGIPYDFRKVTFPKRQGGAQVWLLTSDGLKAYTGRESYFSPKQEMVWRSVVQDLLPCVTAQIRTIFSQVGIAVADKEIGLNKAGMFFVSTGKTTLVHESHLGAAALVCAERITEVLGKENINLTGCSVAVNDNGIELRIPDHDICEVTIPCQTITAKTLPVLIEAARRRLRTAPISASDGKALDDEIPAGHVKITDVASSKTGRRRKEPKIKRKTLVHK